MSKTKQPLCQTKITEPKNDRKTGVTIRDVLNHETDKKQFSIEVKKDFQNNSKEKT